VAGYSKKSLAEKLGIKGGFTVALIDPPLGYRGLLEPLPLDVRFGALADKPEVIHYFATEGKQFSRQLRHLRSEMRDDALLWVSWPKKSSGCQTDMTEDVVRESALPLGLVDTKVCAVDEVWSGLRLVVRLKNRRCDKANISSA
jgi:hypothetical protein